MGTGLPEPGAEDHALAVLREAGPSLSDGELLRFWRAARCDAHKATAAIRVTLAWRAKKRWADTLQEAPLPLFASCVGSIGVDDGGLPVYRVAPGPELLEQLGKRVSSEQLTAQAVLGLETLRGELAAREADARGFTVLLDFREVGLRHLWAAGALVLRGVVDVGEAHYPGLIGRLVVDWRGIEHQLLPRPWTLFRQILSEHLLSESV
eukprot:931386-Prymnesium_polylepis.1